MPPHKHTSYSRHCFAKLITATIALGCLDQIGDRVNLFAIDIIMLVIIIVIYLRSISASPSVVAKVNAG